MPACGPPQARDSAVLRQRAGRYRVITPPTSPGCCGEAPHRGDRMGQIARPVSPFPWHTGCTTGYRTTSTMERFFIATILVLLMPVASSVVGAVDRGPNLEARAVRRVQPAYPALARRHGVEGTVVVGIEVAADGAVARATFMEGNALFKSASVAAAKQWIFRATGEPAGGHIVFTFTRPTDR